jgi:hypothetical protein
MKRKQLNVEYRKKVKRLAGDRYRMQSSASRCAKIRMQPRKPSKFRREPKKKQSKLVSDKLKKLRCSARKKQPWQAT